MNGPIQMFSTKELVDELIRREGVTYRAYKSKQSCLLQLRLSGPAIVLVITD